MRLLVPSTAALVPLLILPGVLTYFDVTPKIAILLFGAALILLYRSENLRNISALLRSRPGRWWVALLAAAFLATAVATAFSLHPALSLNGSNWRRFGLLSEAALLLFALCASAWLAAAPRNVLTILRTIAASGALGALYGIAQYFGFDPLLPAKAYQAGEGPFTIVRPPGTLGHADYFAAWLLVVAFSSLALSQLEKRRWPKAAALISAALALFAIPLSGTRSALLGFLIGAAVYILAARLRIRARSAAGVLTCAAAFALFFFSPLGLKLRARLHWSLDDLRGGARLLLWRDSIRMAAHRPLIGFGPETFVTEFPRFASIDLARAYPDFYHESPHNMFLDAASSRGLLGLVPLMALCGFGVWASVRLVRSRHPLGAPLAAAFAALLVSEQFTVFIVPTALYFYLLLAILVATAPHNPAPSTTALAPRALYYVPLALAASGMLAVFALRLLVADAAFALTERRIAAVDASRAADADQTVLRWQPAGSASDLRYSRDMQQLSAHAPSFAASLIARQEAVKAGIAATRTAEDRQNAWYNLATLFATSNDASSVEHCLRNAIAWAPNWFKPHWTLAQLLELTDHRDQALREAGAAVERDAGRDPEVTATFEKLQKPPLSR